MTPHVSLDAHKLMSFCLLFLFLFGQCSVCHSWLRFVRDTLSRCRKNTAHSKLLEPSLLV